MAKKKKTKSELAQIGKFAYESNDLLALYKNPFTLKENKIRLYIESYILNHYDGDDFDEIRFSIPELYKYLGIELQWSSSKKGDTYDYQVIMSQ